MMAIRNLGLALGVFAVLTSLVALAGAVLSVVPAEVTPVAVFTAVAQLGWPLALWLPFSASAGCVVCAATQPRALRIGWVAMSMLVIVAIALTTTAVAIYLALIFG